MKFSSAEKQAAYNAGGFRERYAMEHGNATIIYIHGEKCIKFTYSTTAEYQDANGAVYNTVKNIWTN